MTTTGQSCGEIGENDLLKQVHVRIKEEKLEIVNTVTVYLGFALIDREIEQ